MVYIPPFWIHTRALLQHRETRRVRFVHRFDGLGSGPENRYVILTDPEDGTDEWLSCSTVIAEWEKTGKMIPMSQVLTLEWKQEVNNAKKDR